MQFSELISPLAQEDFLENYASKQAILIKGDANKFSTLYDWDALNKALSEHRLEPPRCRAEKVGATLSELTIIDYEPSPRGFLVPKVNPDLLYKRLSEGATLVLDAVNETDRRLDKLSCEVGSIFSSRSQINMYVTFGNSAGFGCHWDSRDVFTVQIAGKKHWKIYYPTRESPLYRDFHNRANEPKEIWWEGIVEQGTVVYIPRGWWHDVTGIGVPSMHLTLGADPLTGIDYLTWLADQLRQSALWRKELPRFGGDLEKHKQELIDSLNEFIPKNQLTNFLQSIAEGRTRRPKYSLPYAVNTAGLELPHDKAIKKITNSLIYEVTNDRIILRANNKSIELSLKVESLLQELSKRQSTTLLELSSLSKDLKLEQVRTVITSLIQANILYVD